MQITANDFSFTKQDNRRQSKDRGRDNVRQVSPFEKKQTARKARRDKISLRDIAVAMIEYD